MKALQHQEIKKSGAGMVMLEDAIEAGLLKKCDNCNWKLANKQ